jgi:uncharacterized protein YxeA
MKKINIIFISTIILAVAIGLVHAQTYNNITTITGSSDQTSNYFNIPSSEMRYEWSYTSSAPTYAGLYIDVYQQGNDLPVDIMAASTNQTSGTQYIHNLQPGSYYIKVSAANIDSYTITIEAQASATTAPTPTAPEYPAIIIVIALICIATLSVLAVKKAQTKQ